MSERPTLQTDAVYKYYLCENDELVDSEIQFARKLERERDEARAARNECERQYQEKVAEIAQLLSERDEAREAIRALAEHGESEIKRITKERDETIAECKALWSLVNANKLRAYKAERERDEAREQVDCFREKNDLTPMCWNV